MGLSYQPKAITLSFKEGKPVTYKAQQVTYPTIKSKDLLAYAANAANVPLANIECCVQGLIEAINYFVLNGHAVQLEGLGSFSPRIQNNHDLFSGVVIVVWYDGVNITISHLPMH